ncbi:MAG TPA: rhomboid family intramembrane serine protease [Planctomycetaceae bacterium]|nr:rhomboid family intramembrane serine protease [Planctomycetaceae bacterium]
MFLHVFRRARDELPITSGCLFLAGMLFACVLWTESTEHVKDAIALERWGAVTLPRLWDGQWWRIFVTAFHHGDPLHLIVNSLAIWYFGALLEPRLGSLVYGGFVVASIFVSISAESLFAGCVGLSGMAFAQFGMLLVLRRVDPRVDELFPRSMVRWGFVWLFACIVIDHFELMHIANVAHFAGLAYGWLAGQALWGRWASLPVRALFVTGHLLLIPGIYYDMHPVWRGLYYWHLADEATSDEVRLKNWRRAVELDPSLAPVWKNIALVEARSAHLPEAWRSLILGLKQNPYDDELMKMARELADAMSEPEREAARRELRDAFGNEASDWEWKLLAQAPPPRESAHSEEQPAPRAVHLPIEALGERPDRDRRLPAPNPAQPGTAEEGERT